MMTNNTAAATLSPLSGAWLGAWPSASQKNIEAFQQLTQHHPDVIHTFVNTNQDMRQWQGFMYYVHDQGALNMLTIEIKKNDGSDYSTVDINNGILDAYFAHLAQQMKSWQKGSYIWIRILHEVNGNWYGWSVGDSLVNTNESYKKAFQRIVKIFRKNSAANVKFIYNVNNRNDGNNASYMGAYPGDDYIDYVSMDGYNWGKTQAWSTWEEFRQLFDIAYQALANGSHKPIIISEPASTEIGGNKASWIKDMKKQIKSGAYPKLFAAIWFNEKKETDWRIKSSPSAKDAYQEE